MRRFKVVLIVFLLDSKRADPTHGTTECWWVTLTCVVYGLPKFQYFFFLLNLRSKKGVKNSPFLRGQNPPFWRGAGGGGPRGGAGGAGAGGRPGGAGAG